MSRLINPDSAGKDRTRLSKAIVLSIRELAKQQDITSEAKDLAAFIALALQTIAEGIDASVVAWEKRDYWVKADRFRMEWMWTGQFAEKMKNVTEDSCGGDECSFEECKLMTRVFSLPDTLGASAPADVGFTFQQVFHQYLTEFYHDPGPESFSAVVDG